MSQKETFLAAIQASLDAGTFVRVTLGKFRGGGEAQKVVVTRVVLKDAAQLKFVTSQARKDITKNYAVGEGVAHIAAVAGEEFLSATLFTTAEDVSLLFSKKKVAQLTRGKATFSAAPETEHNRAKQYIVDSTRGYLKALGISDAAATVKPSMYGKFKQICHFIEIMDDVIRESEVGGARALTVVDIGSGKGYLTFALYDYLASKAGVDARVTGIEVRPDLVKLCRDIARNSGFAGLTFDAAKAEQKRSAPADVVIALHACDTATDDALYQGITGNAAVIVTAPCCQHELAPQLGAARGELAGLMKFGLFKQRQADLTTDAARCLLLEASGYKVKVIEFVSTEHTAKNILIAAIRSQAVDRECARRQYEALKALMGFKSLRLETLLTSTA